VDGELFLFDNILELVLSKLWLLLVFLIDFIEIGLNGLIDLLGVVIALEEFSL
jgi:hypothetical protein